MINYVKNFFNRVKHWNNRNLISLNNLERLNLQNANESLFNAIFLNMGFISMQKFGKILPYFLGGKDI